MNKKCNVFWVFELDWSPFRIYIYAKSTDRIFQAQKWFQWNILSVDFAYIYTKLQHLQIQKCKKPSVFCAWNILSVGFAYIYIRNCISNCPLNIIFYLWISRIYIYIRKTVLLNHVYQIYNSRILAFNILSVDPRFFNILTSSPLLYMVQKSWCTMERKHVVVHVKLGQACIGCNCMSLLWVYIFSLLAPSPTGYNQDSWKPWTYMILIFYVFKRLLLDMQLVFYVSGKLYGQVKPRNYFSQEVEGKIVEIKGRQMKHTTKEKTWSKSRRIPCQLKFSSYPNLKRRPWYDEKRSNNYHISVCFFGWPLRKIVAKGAQSWAYHLAKC